MVAGGGGFLAGHLVEKLIRDGHTVRAVELFGRDVSALRRLGVETIAGDLCDPVVADHACDGMDVVFNSAALLAPIGPRERFRSVNVALADNLLASCRSAGVRRFVQVSSPSAVFDGTDHFDADESLPYPANFLNHYSATKAESERRVLAANGTGLETVALRPHAIWGPGDHTLLPRIVERAKAGRLVQIGDGSNEISTLYVENGADALVLAATAPEAAGNVYFVTDDEPVNLWEWVRHILSDLELPPIRRRVPYRLAYAVGFLQELAWRALPLGGEPTVTRYSAAELGTNHTYSIARARSDLGYEPTVDREEGMRRTSTWAREFLL